MASNIDALTSMLQQAFGSTVSQGQKIASQGTANLDPVIAHLTKLLKGDAADVDEAIRPQISGVVSQYDTARRAIAEQTPRGGGSASAITESRFKEAGDISNLRSQAVSGASEELGQIGLKELFGGLTAESGGLSGLLDLLKEEQGAKSSTREFWGKVGSAIGSYAAYAAIAASSRTLKADIEPVGARDVLEGLRQLPISTWRYAVGHDKTSRHLGPMAEDFQRIFGVGDGVTLHLVDVMGVVIAAAKALAENDRG